MESSVSKPKRIFFLDNIKAFIVTLMIVFHIAMSYMAYAPEWWYAVDKSDPQMSFLMFVLWADIFIMPVMFFISGYFGIMSLSKQSTKKFWCSKWLRVGIPWVLGVIFLAGPVTYLCFLTKGVPMSLHDFLMKMFFFGPFFSHTQYWFLGMLMYFYSILFFATKLFPKLKQQLPAKLPTVITFLVLAVLCYVTTVAAYLLVDGNNDLWTNIWPILVYQPTRTPMHLIYFCLGVYAWRNQWFTENGFKADAAKWVPAFIVTGIVYVYYCLFGKMVTTDPMQYSMIKSAMHVLFLMSAVFGLFAVFQSKLNYTNKFLGEWAANSYTMYYAHMGLIMLVVWWLFQFSLPVYVKYVIACILGLGVTYIASKILLFLPFFAGSKKAKQ